MNEQRIGIRDSRTRLFREMLVCVNLFDSYLATRGYQSSTRRVYSASLRHFISWLEARGSCGGRIDTEIRIFLQEHLPICSCPNPVPKYVKTVRAALNQFLLMYGDERMRPFGKPASSAIESAIESFDQHLQNVCGHSGA